MGNPVSNGYLIFYDKSRHSGVLSSRLCVGGGGRRGGGERKKGKEKPDFFPFLTSPSPFEGLFTPLSRSVFIVSFYWCLSQ